jgi:hypothetical protein
MKISVTVDCTPEEARASMGLPDVKPMQEALMKDLEDRMRANFAAMTPDALAKAWMPAWIPGAEQLQSTFWSQLQKMMSGMTPGGEGRKGG